MYIPHCVKLMHKKNSSHVIEVSGNFWNLIRGVLFTIRDSFVV